MYFEKSVFILEIIKATILNYNNYFFKKFYVNQLACVTTKKNKMLKPKVWQE